MKNLFSLAAVVGLTAALLAASGGLEPVRADIFVVDSNAASIKPGARLSPGEKVSVPAGSRILIILPSGKTQTIKGPYEGSVDDLSKGHASNEGVMAWIRNILQTGGSTEATPGATRGIGMGGPKPKLAFSWDDIPVTSNGDFCVVKGARLQLARVASSRAEKATVMEVNGGSRGETQWQAGSDAAAWPANLAPNQDGTYYLIIQDRPRRQIALHVLDSVPPDDEVLSELQKRGCKYQFEAWVREKVAHR